MCCSVRDRNALAKFLEQFIAKELRKWVKTFPGESFEQLCRLKGAELPPDMKLSGSYGKIINDLVFDRIKASPCAGATACSGPT